MACSAAFFTGSISGRNLQAQSLDSYSLFMQLSHQIPNFILQIIDYDPQFGILVSQSHHKILRFLSSPHPVAQFLL
jgi:hypothetical protein